MTNISSGDDPLAALDMMDGEYPGVEKELFFHMFHYLGVTAKASAEEIHARAAILLAQDTLTSVQKARVHASYYVLTHQRHRQRYMAAHVTLLSKSQNNTIMNFIEVYPSLQDALARRNPIQSIEALSPLAPAGPRITKVQGLEGPFTRAVCDHYRKMVLAWGVAADPSVEKILLRLARMADCNAAILSEFQLHAVLPSIYVHLERGISDPIAVVQELIKICNSDAVPEVETKPYARLFDDEAKTVYSRQPENKHLSFLDPYQMPDVDGIWDIGNEQFVVALGTLKADPPDLQRIVSGGFDRRGGFKRRVMSKKEVNGRDITDHGDDRISQHWQTYHPNKKFKGTGNEMVAADDVSYFPEYAGEIDKSTTSSGKSTAGKRKVLDKLQENAYLDQSGWTDNQSYDGPDKDWKVVMDFARTGLIQGDYDKFEITAISSRLDACIDESIFQEDMSVMRARWKRLDRLVSKLKAARKVPHNEAEITKLANQFSTLEAVVCYQTIRRVGLRQGMGWRYRAHTNVPVHNYRRKDSTGSAQTAIPIELFPAQQVESDSQDEMEDWSYMNH